MNRLDIGWKLKRRISSTKFGFNMSPSLLKEESKSSEIMQQPARIPYDFRPKITSLQESMA